MIKCRDIQFNVLDKAILSDINVEFKKGSISGVIGRNGAGKSTLLKIIAGLTLPTSGLVTLKDRSLSSYGANELAQQRSVLSQEIPVNFGLSVVDILLMGRYCYGPLSPFDFEIIDDIVARLDITDLLKTPYPSLSGGERQRVQFARALIQLMPFEKGDKLLILDEPLAALDLSVQQQILGEVSRLVKEYDLSVVMVLHDLNWISHFCDHVYLMNNGRIAEEGTPQSIFNEANLKKYFDVKCNILNNNGRPTMIYNDFL